MLTMTREWIPTGGGAGASWGTARKMLQEQGEGAPCWLLGAQEGGALQRGWATQGGTEPSRGAQTGMARVRGSQKEGAEGPGGSAG